MKRFLAVFVAAALLIVACIAFSPPAAQARDHPAAIVAPEIDKVETPETTGVMPGTGFEAPRLQNLSRPPHSRSGIIERDAFQRLERVARE